MENAVFALWHDPSCWLIYAEADWGIIMVLLGQIDVGGVVWGWMLRSICYSQQTLGLCCLWSPVLVMSLAPVPNEDAEVMLIIQSCRCRKYLGASAELKPFWCCRTDLLCWC
ncbi:hypothetical protein Nepgr_027742 [Nepenthes gracilis]|uniref:Uncharacterized protein n=1 Tax=Nepenthes gracilis TaxID=150966 RepID=A0AAD3TAW3_NEPGR|nr:hypothetical protein Nepgr_027742 [Nepenthes gracilis]